MYSGGGPDLGGFIRVLFVLAVLGIVSLFAGAAAGTLWLANNISISVKHR